MILDALNALSNSQALTVTAASTDTIDLGVERQLGSGEPMAVMVTVGVAMGGTSPTLQVNVQSDDNTGFSSAAVVAASASFSSLPAGSKIVIPIPPNTNTERYLRLNYTLGGTSPTVTVSAHLIPLSHVESYRAYPWSYVSL